MKKGMILISRSEVLRLIAEAEEMALRYDDFAYYLRSKIDELETVKNTTAKYTEKEMLEELKKREAALDKIHELQTELQKIRSLPLPSFAWLQTCARCGRTFEADCGGVPTDPDHPYYHKWICDECDEASTDEMLEIMLSKIPEDKKIMCMDRTCNNNIKGYCAFAEVEDDEDGCCMAYIKREETKNYGSEKS